MIRSVFPGTFDPIHYGHIDIATRAARLFDEVVIAVYARPLKTLLFSIEERSELVRRSFESHKNISVKTFDNLTVEFCKSIDAKVIVRGLRVFSDFEQEFRMALANQRLASGIESVALITHEEHTFLSSSTVREIASLGGDISSMVPEFVETALLKRFKTQGKDHSIENISFRD